MRKIVLDIFAKIVGIAAVSGITYSDSTIHLVSDLDSTINIYKNDALTMTPVIPADSVIYEDGVLNLPKKFKPDFEAIYENDSLIYVFGSGSKKTRNFGYIINKSTLEYEFLDLTWLYDSLRDFADLDKKNFIIKGVINVRAEWIFL